MAALPRHPALVALLARLDDLPIGLTVRTRDQLREIVVEAFEAGTSIQVEARRLELQAEARHTMALRNAAGAVGDLEAKASGLAREAKALRLRLMGE